MLRGELQSAVRWITERKKGGVPHPEDTCPKIGQTVLDVLRSNKTEAHPTTAQSLEAYSRKPLAMVSVYITDTKVATVAQQLSWSAGQEGWNPSACNTGCCGLG